MSQWYNINQLRVETPSSFIIQCAKSGASPLLTSTDLDISVESMIDWITEESCLQPSEWNEIDLTIPYEWQYGDDTPFSPISRVLEKQELLTWYAEHEERGPDESKYKLIKEPLVNYSDIDDLPLNQSWTWDSLEEWCDVFLNDPPSEPIKIDLSDPTHEKMESFAKLEAPEPIKVQMTHRKTEKRSPVATQRHHLLGDYLSDFQRALTDFINLPNSDYFHREVFTSFNSLYRACHGRPMDAPNYQWCRRIIRCEAGRFNKAGQWIRESQRSRHPIRH